MSQSVLVLVFVGPLFGPALVSTPMPETQGRWTSVSLAAELRAKDTDRINVITAGEEQMSSLDRCAAAEDADLCRIIVSAVNVAAIIGSTVTGQ